MNAKKSLIKKLFAIFADFLTSCLSFAAKKGFDKFKDKL